MKKALLQSCGAAAALSALLMTAPLHAAENSGLRPVAEELGQRAAAATTAAPQPQQKSGLTDSAVRVLLTYAFSIIPETTTGADGKPAKVDKSDPNVFMIPDEDARRIIRAATRSAYAEACELGDLARANYNTLMRTEAAKKVWSDQQLLMINALHMFSASYFSGGVKIAEAPDGTATGSVAAKGDAEDGGAAQGTALVAPKRPACPPEQKQKVINSINAYVQSAKAAAPAPSPAAPASSGSN
jgi:hypothetical protein